MVPDAPIQPWRFSPRGIAVRIFITCWIIYGLHFATNTVREIFLTLAIADHASFRVDEYGGLHADLFETPGRGWHIGNNPGTSLIAAVPYAAAKPLVDRIVDRVNQSRRASGITEPPAYDSPWPMAREFFRKAWQQGYDIKFGLAAVVMQALCMAPVSSAGVVLMFLVLRQLFRSDQTALLLSLLYAFGTPVFFRTGFINQNMLVTVVAFAGFVAIWNPGAMWRLSPERAALLAGLAGGLALLIDYTGAIILLALFFYTMIKRWQEADLRAAVSSGILYFLGTLAPVFLLWFYQYRSFGHPFYPGQHWMPNQNEYVTMGYQGVGWPNLGLALSNLFDYRYGLILSCPLLVLALAAPWLAVPWMRFRRPGWPATIDLRAMALLCFFLFLFFSSVYYSLLQFNSGVRYLIPTVPFLFIIAAGVLLRLPRPAQYFLVVFSVAHAWFLAMYRDVERGAGILEPWLHVLLGGFQLPALSTVARAGSGIEYVQRGVSPLPLFALTAAILYGIWSSRIWAPPGKGPVERT